MNGIKIPSSSRKIVGWQVYENESSSQVANLMTDICQREGIKPNQVTLHSTRKVDIHRLDER